METYFPKITPPVRYLEAFDLTKYIRVLVLPVKQVNPVSSYDFPNSNSCLFTLFMAGVNVNQPNPLPAWRARSPLNLTPPLHNLPQAFDKLLPKFDPEERIVVDDNLQIFYLSVKG